MAYSARVVDHYDKPGNVRSFRADTPGVGTGLVGAPECGDVMKLPIQGEPGDRGDRGRPVQDLRLRERDRVIDASPRRG